MPPMTSDEPGNTTGPSNRPHGTRTYHDTRFPPITHTHGPVKPTCTKAGGCGMQCRHNCLPCFLDCSENDNDNWWDANDPNRPKPSGRPGEPQDCETRTYSSCGTQCVKQAAEPSCTSSCKGE